MMGSGVGGVGCGVWGVGRREKGEGRWGVGRKKLITDH